MVKTYDMENVSTGWDAVYKMVEIPDGAGDFVRTEDYKVLEAALDSIADIGIGEKHLHEARLIGVIECARRALGSAKITSAEPK